MLHTLLHFGNGAAFFVLALIMSIIDVRCTHNNFREFLRMKIAVALMGFCGTALGIACTLMMVNDIDVGLLLNDIVPMYYYIVMNILLYVIIQALKVRDIYTDLLYFSSTIGFFLLFFDCTAFFLDGYNGEVWSQEHFVYYQNSTTYEVISVVSRTAFAVFALYVLIFIPHYGRRYVKLRKAIRNTIQPYNLDGVVRLLISTLLFILFGVMENVFPEEWSHYLFTIIAPILYVFIIDAIMRINFEAMEDSGEEIVAVKGFSTIVGSQSDEDAAEKPDNVGFTLSDYEAEIEREKARRREKVLAIAEASERLFKVEKPEEPAPVEVPEEKKPEVMVDVQSLKLSDRDKFMEVLIERWAERESRPYTNVELTVADLAGELNMPERVLSRIIHDKYGLTFNSWLNFLRMNDIKRQLDANPNARVTALFKEMGFSDTSTATKIFKRFVGMTPTEYKQQLLS